MRDVEDKITRSDDPESSQGFGAMRPDALEVVDGHVEVDLPPRLRGRRHLSLENLAREFRGIEWQQVGGFLADAEEFHRHVQSFVDG